MRLGHSFDNEFGLIGLDSNPAMRVVSWIPDPRNAIVPALASQALSE
jgi:hypothetical protein